jgi:hypothetical protein
VPAVNEILSGGYLVRESDEDVSNNTNYRAGVVDRSEGRLASVGLIKVLEEDMADMELIPFKFCTKEDKITPGHEKGLGEIIRTTNQFSDAINGAIWPLDEGVYVLQVVTTTADPVVGSLEQLELKSP